MSALPDFAPGLYRLRNGGKAEVFCTKDGRIWGRYQLIPDEDRHWQPARWELDGRFRDAYEESYNLDLMDPLP